MKGYINKIRSKLGHDKFIHPAARIIIENQVGEILFIERLDNGKIGIPAGALEEGETIEACIKREVKEETGLTIMELEVIGISTNPMIETVKYANNDEIQYFTVEFYAKNWQGVIKVKDKTEIKAARFMAVSNIDRLPKNELSAFESLNYYRKNKRVMLK